MAEKERVVGVAWPLFWLETCQPMDMQRGCCGASALGVPGKQSSCAHTGCTLYTRAHTSFTLDVLPARPPTM